MTMPSTVYLVSGANRGIGLGLVTYLASRPDSVVFAGARNPGGATALHELVAQHPEGTVHVVQLTSGDETDNAQAVEEIRKKAGRLDVVIANAGVCSYYGPAESTPASAMHEHFDASATRAPMFLPITSGAGLSANAGMALKVLAYGCSKAAENFLTRRLHFEHEKDGLVCFAISPGPVKTDLSGQVIDNPEVLATLPKFLTVEEAAPQLVKLVDEGTRENYGGRVVHISGKVLDF